MKDPIFDRPDESDEHAKNGKSEREMRRQATRVAINSPRLDDVKRANGCQCCARPGSEFPRLSALEFHHAGHFRYNIARRKYRAWEDLVREMLETILLCHRCHGRLHAGLVSVRPCLRVVIPAYLVPEMVSDADTEDEAMPSTNAVQSGAGKPENRP